MVRVLIVILMALTHWKSYAGGLTAPFSMGSTQVLPKGVRSLRVGGINTAVDNWYNDKGNITGVAEPFDQQLTYGRLLKAEKDENLKLNVESQLKNKNVGLDEIAGRSFADINTTVTVTMPALAYGVTNRWTIAAVVPVIYSNLSVATSYTGTQQLQELVNNFSEKSRSQTAVIQQKLSDVIQTEITTKNYKPLADEEKTEVGDVTLVSKVLLHKGLSASWALTNTVSIPTARNRDASKVVDVNPGDGQWDIGTISTLQIPFSSKWSMVHQLGYTVQLPDYQDTRVPISLAERLSADYDGGAYRDLGDIMFTSLGFSYSPTSVFNIGTAYQFSYKEADVWRGAAVADTNRYNALSVETEQNMQAAYLQLGLSSVAAYRRGSFPVPMSANLGYAHILDGRNVRDAPVWNLNVSMFF